MCWQPAAPGQTFPDMDGVIIGRGRFFPSMPQSVASSAGSNDVGCTVLTAIAPGSHVFSRALEANRLAL